MERIERPYYPIIYVRGYAMTRDEIVETTSTPFMGFEAGSTKMRQAQDGSVVKFVFESPLVRLMKDHNYRDVYEFGAERRDRISPRCIVIHRYYDPADPAFGDGRTPSIIDAATSLGRRIEELRDSVCGNNAAMRRDFRVYLVAHSMGGLICRCLLQNPEVASAQTRAMVDKVFTYATPHNGIEVGGINLPNLLSINDLNNFNRTNMGKYLKVPKDKVNTLGKAEFPPQRMFCLIGTNSRDYAAAHGLSSFAVGALSDGLVRIANAYVEGAPRAFVNRSHSGYFGIVNSEEGYQNLVRFLFGDTCATAQLDISALPFPPEIEAARRKGKKIQSSYYIESTVAPRGAYTYELTSRTQANQCAIRRSYDEMFNADGSVRVPGQEGGGHAERGAPGGANDGWSKERIAQSGTWLKRPPYDYTPTSFDKYWVPQESLLAEWVRKGIKSMEIPLPGTGTKISCVISILQAGGGCGLTNPNMQDQPAVARPPPDIPFKKELQEDNGSR